VDETVLFKPLTMQELERIVELQLESVGARLADRRLTLTATEAAKEHLAREGYDPVYGARPLRRFIQRGVETRIGRALIAGDVTDGSEIVVDFRDGRLTIDWQPAGEVREPVGAAG
jgi:ATP-dependent Clp protease ATP-binding subunit ClpB